MHFLLLLLQLLLFAETLNASHRTEVSMRTIHVIHVFCYASPAIIVEQLTCTLTVIGATHKIVMAHANYIQRHMFNENAFWNLAYATLSVVIHIIFRLILYAICCHIGMHEIAGHRMISKISHSMPLNEMKFVCTHRPMKRWGRRNDSLTHYSFF